MELFLKLQEVPAQEDTARNCVAVRVCECTRRNCLCQEKIKCLKNKMKWFSSDKFCVFSTRLKIVIVPHNTEMHEVVVPERKFLKANSESKNTIFSNSTVNGKNRKIAAISHWMQGENIFLWYSWVLLQCPIVGLGYFTANIWAEPVLSVVILQTLPILDPHACHFAAVWDVKFSRHLREDSVVVVGFEVSDSSRTTDLRTARADLDLHTWCEWSNCTR